MSYDIASYAYYELHQPRPRYRHSDITTFIRPRLDYGFKHIFSDRRLLLSLLNSMLPAGQLINDLSLLPQEEAPDTQDGKLIIYDILGISDKKERIIVEMQNQPQRNLYQRMMAYDSRQVLAQLNSQDKEYGNIKAVYSFWFLNFVLDEKSSQSMIWDGQMSHYPRELLAPIRLVSESDSESIRRRIIQLPLFKKTLDEIETTQDKWLYFINNVDKLDDIPPIFEQDEIFRLAFERARCSAFTEEQMELYTRLLEGERVYNETLNYARDKGLEQGLEQGIEQGIEQGAQQRSLEIALNLLKRQMPLRDIVDITGLSEEAILKLKAR